MEAGLKYIHNDMCYPAICSLGQQLHAITSGTYDPADVAFVQFQTGGGCRALQLQHGAAQGSEQAGAGDPHRHPRLFHPCPGTAGSP